MTEWWSTPPPVALPPGNAPVLILQEARWTPGPVWTGTENLSRTEIRSPDRPARSGSLIPTELFRSTSLPSLRPLLPFKATADAHTEHDRRGHGFRQFKDGRSPLGNNHPLHAGRQN
jgi:hypothetical protein